MAGLGYGVWLGADLVTGLFGWLGIGFGDSWFTGFVQSAKWTGYSLVIVLGFVIPSLGFPSATAGCRLMG